MDSNSEITINTKQQTISLDGTKYVLKEMVSEKLVKWYHYTIEAAMLKAKHYKPKYESLKEDIATLLQAENFLCYLALNNGNEKITPELILILTQMQKDYIVQAQNILNNVENLDKIFDLSNVITEFALNNYQK